MFRNYLITALRNLVRNRFYAAINIVGLAVGFAAALLIALFVRDEFSHDTWLPDHERVFAVTGTWTFPGRTPSESHKIPVELGDSLKLDFAATEAVAAVVEVEASLRRGQVEAKERVYWADPEIFEILSLPAIAGDLRSALRQPDGLVLTQRVAEKYFGTENPVGASLELDRQHIMTVRAVIANLPSATHLATEIFGSGLAAHSRIAQIKANPPRPGEWLTSGYIYLKAKPGIAGEELEREMPAFLGRHKAENLPGSGRGFESLSLWITPVTSIHLKTDNGGSAMRPTGDAATAVALAAIGGLILFVASINFVNLMTARATRRAVEVGVRKVTGAARVHLISQFLGEATLYAALSAVLAVVIVQLLLPSFNAFLGREIVVGYAQDMPLLAAIVGIVAMVGILAGAYPAFVLSSFRPATALKSLVKPGAAAERVRKMLVVLQFAILIGLVVSVGIIYRQSSFALNEGLRLDKDQVLLVETQCKTSFVDQVRSLQGVQGAACSDVNGLHFGTSNHSFRRAGMEPLSLARFQIDFGYLELYGLKPLAGRFFDRGRGSDSGAFYARNAAGVITGYNMRSPGQAIVLNETAVRRLGFSSAEEAVGQSISWNLTLPPGVVLPANMTIPRFEIIGVVPDFSLDSIHNLASPSVYFIDPSNFQWVSIKLTGRNVPETVASIDRLWKDFGDPRPLTRLFLDQEVQKLYLDIQRQSQLFLAFAIVALFIAALGLFGLSAFTAEQRTKEIGIRKAMGATKRDILRLLLWQFTKPVLWANVIAWPVAYLVMRRWLEGFAYHIDLAPWMFLAASALAVAIAVLTVIGHALLVARAKPVTALRYE